MSSWRSVEAEFRGRVAPDPMGRSLGVEEGRRSLRLSTFAPFTMPAKRYGVYHWVYERAWRPLRPEAFCPLLFLCLFLGMGNVATAPSPCL